MNAAQPPHQIDSESGDGHLSVLSALVDGELLPHELDGWLATRDDEGEGFEQWSRYQVIGEVLRGAAPPLSRRSQSDFLAGVRSQLQAGELPAPRVLAPVRPSVVAGGARGLAANDSVFRWKMVAGLASVAAVMAVSWTLLSATSGGQPFTGGEMAQSQMPFELAAVPAAEAGASAQPLVVVTPHGTLLRDAQLEVLMAQHRQYGSASALQLPTGFLRNATYDAPAR